MTDLSLKLVLAFCFFITNLLAVQVPLTLLDEEAHPKAKCLDGSPGGYYAQEAKDDASKNKWVIYLKGGGECDTEEHCLAQTQNDHGSSKFFPPTWDSTQYISYIASDNCKDNPEFCNWNQVTNPYCSQDIHSGQVTTPSEDTWGLYFAGHFIIEAILDEMDGFVNKLTDATEIIVLGASAGGIGTWMHVDHIAARYPQARVSGLTVAGHYFYANYYTGPDSTTDMELSDFTEAGWENAYHLYNAYVDESCKAAYEEASLSPFPCMLSSNSQPYVSSDVYVVQSQTDSVVLRYHDNWPEAHMSEEPEQAYMHDWHLNMTSALSPLQKSSKNGAFAAACYTHTDFLAKKPTINGVGFMEAYTNFYYNRTASEGFNFADDCGEMCNPSCV